MLGHRELGLNEYVGILRRRVWMILVPALIIPVIAFVVSLKIPNRYTSQTLVLVENQRIPESYVKPVITQDLSYRLSTMQEQILSRSRLEPIIQSSHLYADAKDIDEKLKLMRSSISVKPVAATAGKPGSMPGFTIAFTYSEPRIAQQVCSQITSMFIEENLKARQQSAEGTTDFLEKQLAESKRTLDEQDARLASFKTKYIGQLPEQAQTNMNLLSGATAQLDAVTQAIARAQQDKTYTESMLQQQIAAWESTQKEGGTAANPSTIEQQLVALQSQLVALKTRYTDDYPDVAKTEHEIQQLKARLAAADKAATAAPVSMAKKEGTIEPPQIQQLRSAIRQYQETITEKTREQARLQSQIAVLQGRVQMTPKVEEEYKQLTRDYQTALNFYNELLAKKSQSQMATSLELRQQGEQFRVVDPPNLPFRPSFPNRPLFALGGFAGGLVLGAMLAFIRELFDKSLRTEEDVTFYLKLPALAVVPMIGEVAERNRSGIAGKLSPWKRYSRQHSEPRRETVGV